MTTPVLGLPEVTSGQASQASVHNEALRELDAKIVRIKSRTTSAEPGSPTDGDAYLIPTGATGTDWSGEDGKIGLYLSTAWEFYTPAEGWRVWVNDDDELIRYDGSNWDVLATLPYMPSISVGAGSFSVTATAHRGRVLICDTDSGSPTGNITLNLPAAATAGDGFVVSVIKTTSTDTVTIDGNGAETINGSATLSLTEEYDSRILVCDGSEWVTIGGGGGSSTPHSDSSAHIENSSDSSKTFRFDASSISTSTERVGTFQDKDGTFAYLSDIPGGGAGDDALAEDTGSPSHSGLNYNYLSGTIRVDNIITAVGAGSISLTDNTTNYVECDSEGSVSANVTGFSAGSFPMAEVVTSSGVISTVTDRRAWINFPQFVNENFVVITGTTRTLTATDRGKTLLFTNASTVTVTLPETSTEQLIAGFNCELVCRGAGGITIASEGSDTTESAGSDLTIPQYGRVRIVKLDEDTGSPAANIWGLYQYEDKSGGGSGGKVAQFVSAEDGTAKSTTSSIPLDGTIPQNTEGASYSELDITISPDDASSTLLLEAVIYGSASSVTSVGVAMFKDSDADAIASIHGTIHASDYGLPIVLRRIVTAGSTSSRTYKIRFGSSSGATAYINRTSSQADIFSTTARSTFTVTEYTP